MFRKTRLNARSTTPSQKQRRHPVRHLQVERMEDRSTPSASSSNVLGSVVQQINLVSDLPGVAQITDPNLVNPWGIALSPGGGTMWISDNGTGITSLFRGGVNGQPFVRNPGLPKVAGLGAPTGQVFNPSSDFVISAADGTSGPAIFIFVSEDGTITAWNPNVPPPAPSTNAQLAVQVPDAIFKGVTIDSIGDSNFLYAADFHNGTIDVFNGKFAPVTLGKTAFRDNQIPSGFAPFNIENINGNLYVTFAKQDADRKDNVDGPRLGFVDVFDAKGNLLQRLAQNGPLNSPWGLAQAPAGFGRFAGDILVGNFGDGHINAFNPRTGHFDGQLTNAVGQPIAIPSLWALKFGNGVSVGEKSTLFFTAGLDDESHGLLGTLTMARTDVIVSGATVSGIATVNVFDAATHALKFTIAPFGKSFSGEVRVAVGDVNGDGIPDIIAGQGAAPTKSRLTHVADIAAQGHVRVFDGVTGQPLAGPLGDLQPFGGAGGVFVAAGDVNGDGFADVIASADAGQQPVVEVFDGQTGMAISKFLADSPTFQGGVRVAAGDIDGDGRADIITGSGIGGIPEVRIFNASGQKLRSSFLAGDPSFRGGVFVAAGDVNGDGIADIVTGLGAGSKPHVSVFNGKDLSLIGSFQAAEDGFTGGIRVAVTHVNGKTIIATGHGKGGNSDIALFDATSFKPLGSIASLDSNFLGGIYVG